MAEGVGAEAGEAICMGLNARLVHDVSTRSTRFIYTYIRQLLVVLQYLKFDITKEV